MKAPGRIPLFISVTLLFCSTGYSLPRAGMLSVPLSLAGGESQIKEAKKALEKLILLYADRERLRAEREELEREITHFNQQVFTILSTPKGTFNLTPVPSNELQFRRLTPDHPYQMAVYETEEVGFRIYFFSQELQEVIGYSVNTLFSALNEVRARTIQEAIQKERLLKIIQLRVDLRESNNLPKEPVGGEREILETRIRKLIEQLNKDGFAIRSSKTGTLTYSPHPHHYLVFGHLERDRDYSVKVHRGIEGRLRFDFVNISDASVRSYTLDPYLNNCDPQREEQISIYARKIRKKREKSTDQGNQEKKLTDSEVSQQAIEVTRQVLEQEFPEVMDAYNDISWKKVSPNQSEQNTEIYLKQLVTRRQICLTLVIHWNELLGHLKGVLTPRVIECFIRADELKKGEDPKKKVLLRILSECFKDAEIREGDFESSWEDIKNPHPRLQELVTGSDLKNNHNYNKGVPRRKIGSNL